MKTASRLSAFLLAVFLVALSVLPASAAQTVSVKSEPPVSFVLPNGYTVLTADNLSEHGELLSFLGQSETEAKKRFNEGYLALGVSEDYRKQIAVVRCEDDASASVRDLTALSEDALPYAKRLLTDSLVKGGDYAVSVTETSLGGRRFFCAKGYADDPKGDAFLQYITVIDSVSYAICFFDQSRALSDADAEAVAGTAASLQPQRGADEGLHNRIQRIVVWVLLVLLAALLIFCLLRIRSVRRAREIQEDYLEKAPKRPRR